MRIDRVDRLLDGARVLIDYKTGAATADWRGERPDNPQLPVYALLSPDALVAVAYAKVNAAESGFVAESERRDIFPRTRPQRIGRDGDFRRLWSKFGRGASSGSPPSSPPVTREVAPTLKACQSCKLQGLCRVPAALEEEDEFHE